MELGSAKAPRIGDVYMMEFYGKGSAQNGFRPGIIIQNNIGNQNSPNVVAIPLTSAIKKMGQPTHVLLPSDETGLKMNSIALCECPMSIPKDNIGVYVTTIPHHYMREVAIAFLLEHPVLTYLDASETLKVRKESYSLVAA